MSKKSNGQRLDGSTLSPEVSRVPTDNNNKHHRSSFYPRLKTKNNTDKTVSGAIQDGWLLPGYQYLYNDGRYDMIRWCEKDTNAIVQIRLITTCNWSA